MAPLVVPWAFIRDYRLQTSEGDSQNSLIKGVGDLKSQAMIDLEKQRTKSEGEGYVWQQTRSAKFELMTGVG